MSTSSGSCSLQILPRERFSTIARTEPAATWAWISLGKSLAGSLSGSSVPEDDPEAMCAYSEPVSSQPLPSSPLQSREHTIVSSFCSFANDDTSCRSESLSTPVRCPCGPVLLASLPGSVILGTTIDPARDLAAGSTAGVGVEVVVVVILSAWVVLRSSEVVNFAVPPGSSHRLSQITSCFPSSVCLLSVCLSGFNASVSLNVAMRRTVTWSATVALRAL